MSLILIKFNFNYIFLYIVTLKVKYHYVKYYSVLFLLLSNSVDLLRIAVNINSSNIQEQISYENLESV